jgi:hypothetical protein
MGIPVISHLGRHRDFRCTSFGHVMPHLLYLYTVAISIQLELSRYIEKYRIADIDISVTYRIDQQHITVFFDISYRIGWTLNIGIKRYSFPLIITSRR